jgi:hypothetical protein
MQDTPSRRGLADILTRPALGINHLPSTQLTLQSKSQAASKAVSSLLFAAVHPLTISPFITGPLPGGSLTLSFRSPELARAQPLGPLPARFGAATDQKSALLRGRSTIRLWLSCKPVVSTTAQCTLTRPFNGVILLRASRLFSRHQPHTVFVVSGGQMVAFEIPYPT